MLEIYKKVLTNTQYNVLEFLERNPNSRMIDIKHGLDMTSGNVASVLARFVRKGIIIREDGENIIYYIKPLTKAKQ